METKTKEKAKGVNAKERRRIEAEKRKGESAKRKGIEGRVALLESKILALEEEQAAISKQLEDPSSYADQEKAKELNVQATRISKRLEEKNYEWEVAAEELSGLL
jgi:ATP-binding cassette subfamily F protein 3